MNILFICDEYPPGLNGGIGSITQSLANAMVKEGHNVFVAGLYPVEYGSADYEDDNGVKVWRLRYQHYLPKNNLLKQVNRNLPGFIKKKLRNYKSYELFITFITNLIAKEKIDIIEMPDWNTFIYDIGIDSKIPSFKVPLVVKFHCSRSYLNAELGLPIRKKWLDIDRNIFNRGDALAAVSRYTAEQTNKLFNAQKSIRVLYNGIEIQNKNHSQERLQNLVFFSGTLVKNKGVFSLMKAWNIVLKHIPDAELIVFGKGNINALKKILDPDAVSSVVFKGHQPKSQLLDTLSKATVAVYPSYTEAFSMAPLESMSMACPTIFTSRASGKEVIEDGITGFLVDPDDIEQIAGKILLILQSKELEKSIGEAGKAEVSKKFDIRTSVSEHLKFYQETINSFSKEHNT